MEMGLVMRRNVFTRLGGFTESIGMGASTPWQSGEATDLLLRLIQARESASFVWLPSDVAIGGVSDPHGNCTAKTLSTGRALTITRS